MSVILNSIEQYFDLDGSPLQNGYLYFGEINGNPVTNPVVVYFDPEYTIPAAQPIRTVNGYPVRSGTATGIYAPDNVSILVQNSKREQIVYVESSAIDVNQSSFVYRQANEILTTDDNGKTIIASGTFTQTFDASVVLGSSWSIQYVNIGNGNITFNPNLSETIDNVTSKVISPSQSCYITCDGINLTTTLTPSDNNALRAGSSDKTKLARLELDGLTSGTTRVLTVQDRNLTLAGIDEIVNVRQTVLSGAVDSNGFSAFGGSTGSTTVTASTTLVVTAANGTINRTGTITNPSWDGLGTNGTMYLFLDIASDGTCTTSSTDLAPIYQNGGSYSTTNKQFTFNIQEMVGKVGVTTTANQVYRVFVGEVTVAAGVVSAIRWYALMGRYQETGVAIPAVGTATTKNHNLGIKPRIYKVSLECVTAEAGYAIGDEIPLYENGGGPSYYASPCAVTSTTIKTVTGNTNTVALNITTGVSANLTKANWTYKFTASRGW